jgi:predicted dehydrogenase
MPLRFAIMGTGLIARGVAPHIQAVEGCGVVAAASRKAEHPHVIVA